MSENLFSQATPAQTADATGTQEQVSQSQDGKPDLEAQFRELKSRFDVVQKRVDDKEAFINKLRDENERLKAEVANKAKLDDVLEKLNGSTAQQKSDVQANTSSLDPDKLLEEAEKRVLTKLEQKQLEEKAQANFQAVAQELVKVYGADVDSKVKAIAAENDLTYDEAVSLAKSKPKAFLKLFKEVKEAPQASPQVPSKSSFNTTAVHQQSKAKEPVFDRNNSEAMKEWVRFKMAEAAKQHS